MEFVSLEKKKDLCDIGPIIADFKSGKLKEGDCVTLRGFVHKVRAMSGFAFIIIRTPRLLVQCVHNYENKNIDINSVGEEDSVEVVGTIKKDDRSNLGFEIHLTELTVFSKGGSPLPVTINKWKLDCGLEANLDYRPISLRNPCEKAIIKLNAGIMRGFRNYLDNDGFTEFVPPKIVSAGAEGGADMFEVDYFGRVALLAQSPQMYKQMMVGVFNKVYTVSPVFRAEKHSTSRHINEFQGLDLEMGFIDSFEDVMRVEGGMMAYIFKMLNEEYAPELEKLKVTLPEIKSIPKVRFKEAKELIAQKYDKHFRSPYDLEPEEEKLIGQYFMDEYGSPFVFVTHYPSSKRPFYAMDDPEDPKYTLSFDLLLNGTEITTGGQRIHDYESQLKKMRDRNMDPEMFKDYLMIHKYGMPPHGGLGLGLERLAMKMFNLDNIKRAAAFPRDISRLNP